jgi:GNAT superfamily N-acetyltransferase
LRSDDVNTLLPSFNPAFDFCEAVAYMAFRDGKPVGRIVGIVNTAVNERTGSRDCRFGFVDFIDDNEVVDALFDAVKAWGRSKGLTSLVGPLGFTDMDHEGALIEGYDQEGTMSTIYNYPYYIKHYERLGFQKDADWVEFRITIPQEIPEKMQRIADIVRRKYGLQTIQCTSRKALKEEFGRPLFDCINRAYDKLYGYSPLTPRQIEHYIGMYLGLIRLDNICVIADANRKLVGIGIALPSLSSALRKSKGRLFPTGWWPLLKSLKFKGTKVVDLLLVAIDPEYQGKGVNALLFTELIPKFIACGYTESETNPELEDNSNVQLQWQYFEHRLHKRRRSYRTPID